MPKYLPISFLLIIVLALSSCTALNITPTVTVEPTILRPLAPTATAVPTEAPTTTVEPTATPSPSAPQPITLTDDLNRKVELPGPAQRIVSLAASNTEILYAIGAGAQVVGRDAYSDYPDEAKSVQNIGDGISGFNTEMIVSLKPDLVLAAEIIAPEQVKALEDLGLKIYWLGNPKTIEEMYAKLQVVAQLTGHVDETGKLIDSLKARVTAVDEKIAGVKDHTVVFYELDATNPAAPYTSGPGTFIDLLLTRAGGKNLGSSMQGQWVQFSLEALIKADPQIILLGDALWGGITPEQVAARAGWEALSAVKEGHIYPFDDNLISRPGPRMVDGLEQLAKLLHPDLFK